MEEVLACREEALILMGGRFPPLVELGAASPGGSGSLGALGALGLEVGGLAELWMPRGRTPLLGRSSGRIPLLLSLLPSDEALRLVGNPFTGSFEEAAGRPDDPDAGC